jgi:hypothetical protein
MRVEIYNDLTDGRDPWKLLDYNEFLDSLEFKVFM